MKSQLSNAFESIDPLKLTESDKWDMIDFFIATKNSALRDRIAIIFADARFHEAVPFLLKKINDKTLFNRNSTLVFALIELGGLQYFSKFIEIITCQGYEAASTALSAINEYAPNITIGTKRKAVKILKEYKIPLNDQVTQRKYFIKDALKILEKK